MPLSLRILAALVAGLLVGAGLAAVHGPATAAVAGIAQTVGGLWLDGLRMTIVPLVFSLVTTSVASTTGAAAGGRLAARTLALFAVLLLAASAIGALTVLGIVHAAPIPPQAADALRAGLGQHSAIPALPPVGDWLRSFVPTNPVASAAGGAIAPLVTFAFVLGVAVTRIADEPRRLILEVLTALTDAMLVIVQWVLVIAPLGVFALALQMGLSGGLGVGGALIHYVATISAACLSATLLVYPLAVLAGRVPLGRFARAAAPVQALAISTQSSLACLPALVESAQGPLAVPERVANLVLPLAVSIFRVATAAANVGVAVYLAVLFGAPLPPLTLATGIVVAAVVSMATAGVPSTAFFIATIAPVCLAMGAPIEALPLLLAVETVPDIFRTIGNVTADLACAAIAKRWDAREIARPNADPAP
ncbi:MAG TPA: cation:dicarboxylase symporter family transporter [Caulobacteraceae bacterium]|jgi:Na+/H+-dicarboxylate symporter|nr:cation:dicarboxylase symporter family transporter [Caulobacteraceae bacterium]